MNGETKVLACTCKHEYEDQRYGARMRLHNKCNKGFRCTICSSIKEAKK